jgi:DNA helicase HerA-like ATPase
MSSTPLDATPFGRRLALHERRSLEGGRAPRLDPTVLDGLEFLRVRGLAAFWRRPGAPPLPRSACDLAVSVHEAGGPLVVVLAGAPVGLSAYVALEAPGQSGGTGGGTTARFLQAAYPGIAVEPGRFTRLGSGIGSRFAYGGVITGVPGPRRPAEAEDDESGGLARVVRGMRGATWCYVVRAWPGPAAEAWTDRDRLMRDLTTVMPATKRSVQRTRQETVSRTDHASRTASEVMGGEMVDAEAQLLVEVQRRELERLEEALALGRWNVRVDFGATEPDAASRLGSLLRSVLSGVPSASADLVRVTPFGSPSAHESELVTALSSRELGTLIQLPREEVPGYQIADYAPFDVDPRPESRPAGRITLGKVLRDGSDSGTELHVHIDDLAKHALVAGVTGSGKTTTVSSILIALHSAKVPFLVVEPAKTEYRALLGLGSAGAPAGPMPDLRVFTLGNDRVAPFRFNPFEFETEDDPERSLLLAHIDLLKAVFNAAFVLYAPMPYVLEMALHEVYEDRGWSLASGRNLRLSPADWRHRDALPIFPTLGDLARKVETVTRRLGYEARIEQDVIAGLRARIGSLRVGSKGLMLDVPRGLSIRELLQEPTLLELESIGNDPEKAFLIGLVLARLYERRRLQAASGDLPAGTQHILVIEEAHRLFRHVNTDVDLESANLRAQAVESLVHMLSEVRRYGQGVILADQVPTKLAVDAIKNTNLKVMHRIVAADDRATLAGATNMSEPQSRQLATLLPGQAAVFSEGADRPLLVAVPDVLADRRQSLRDDALGQWTAGRLSIERSLPVRGLERFGIPVARFGVPDPDLMQRAQHFIDAETGPAPWARLLLRAAHSSGAVAEEVLALSRRLAAATPQLPQDQLSTVLRLVLVCGSARALEERAADYGLPFTSLETLHAPLAGALLAVARDEAPAAAQHLAEFSRAYRPATQRPHGPYPGCVACSARCGFGPESRRLLTTEQRHLLMNRLSNPNTVALKRFADAATLARTTVAAWSGGDASTADALAFCAVLTAAAQSRLDESQQADIARQAEPHLPGRGVT